MKQIEQLESLMNKQKTIDLNQLKKEKLDLENILDGIHQRGEEVVNTKW